VVSINSDRMRPTAPASRGWATLIIEKIVTPNGSVDQHHGRAHCSFVKEIFALWGAHATLCA
ncbi:MAG: hypothetical protein ACO2YO_09100, partial [Paracoccaceae bacterium]